jgi:hypothetical protein
LTKIRNSYVHPKVTNVLIDLEEFEDVGNAYSVSLSLTGKPTASLKIDLNAMFWSHSAAVSGVTATVNFFNYFFVDLLELRPEQILGVLCPLLFITDDSPIVFHQQCFADDLKLLENFDVENRFLLLEAVPEVAGTQQEVS